MSNKPWYDEASRPGALWAAVDEAIGYSADRSARLLHCSRLYGDTMHTRYGGMNTEPQRRAINRGVNRPLSLNIVRNMVDTATSKLTLTRPGAEWLPLEGDFSARQAAKQRKDLVDGSFDAGGFWPLRRRAIKSAALYGTGVGKVVELFGRVAYEYVFPSEVIVDERECMTRAPLNIYQEHSIAKDLAIAKWPGHREAIEKAASPTRARNGGLGGSTDMVLIREGWHMNPQPGKAGVQCATLQDEVLYRRPFRRKHQQLAQNQLSVGPFVFWRWSEEPLGFWGSGLGDQLSSIQWEINQLLRMIQNNMYLGANIKIFLERGSKVIDAQLSNDLRAAIVDYTGTPPQYHVHDVITNQVLQHLQTLIQAAYEITGISQSSASGQIPSGLTGSGRAQLVYQNIESKRFVSVQRQDEEAVVAAHHQTVELAQEIQERDGSFKVHLAGKNWVYEVNSKEALAEQGEMQLKPTPASQLPHDYASKVALAEQFQANGWADAEEAMELAEIPNTDAFLTVRLAPRKLIESMLERMLERGEPVQPAPRMNLQMAHSMGTQAYNHAVLNKYPQENVDLVNNWLLVIEEMMAPTPTDAGAQITPDMAQPGPSQPSGLPVDGLPPVTPAPQTMLQ